MWSRMALSCFMRRVSRTSGSSIFICSRLSALPACTDAAPASPATFAPRVASQLVGAAATLALLMLVIDSVRDATQMSRSSAVDAASRVHSVTGLPFSIPSEAMQKLCWYSRLMPFTSFGTKTSEPRSLITPLLVVAAGVSKYLSSTASALRGGGSTNQRRFHPTKDMPDLRPPSLCSQPDVGAPVLARLMASLMALAHAARSDVVDAANTSSCFTWPLGQCSMKGHLRMSAKAFIAGVIAYEVERTGIVNEAPCKDCDDCSGAAPSLPWSSYHVRVVPWSTTRRFFGRRSARPSSALTTRRYPSMSTAISGSRPA
mmetsp:Transcript_3743/g.6138  ORF Transcript_3743/g.6138 Transcript_3743/m.6138 type:complete len:316 (-) Transcript_3743:727-1674(-)